jgi:hypothetical protein
MPWAYWLLVAEALLLLGWFVVWWHAEQTRWRHSVFVRPLVTPAMLQTPQVKDLDQQITAHLGEAPWARPGSSRDRRRDQSWATTYGELLTQRLNALVVAERAAVQALRADLCRRQRGRPKLHTFLPVQ